MIRRNSWICVTKKAPKYLRVEIEDSTNSVSVFADRNEPIAQSDFYYALVGDRTLHMYADVYDYVDTELYKLTQVIRQGKDHEFGWVYGEGVDTAENSNTVMMYIFSVRTFTTNKGKEMACVYGWDGERFVKIVIFPALYQKIRPQLSQRGWHAAKLEEMADRNDRSRLDSYKLKNAFSLITMEDFVNRKGLKQDAKV